MNLGSRTIYKILWDFSVKISIDELDTIKNLN